MVVRTDRKASAQKHHALLSGLGRLHWTSRSGSSPRLVLPSALLQYLPFPYARAHPQCAPGYRSWGLSSRSRRDHKNLCRLRGRLPGQGFYQRWYVWVFLWLDEVRLDRPWAQSQRQHSHGFRWHRANWRWGARVRRAVSWRNLYDGHSNTAQHGSTHWSEGEPCSLGSLATIR